ncbi:sulfotransferase domain-containing protein [Bacteroidota bacterium]
MKYKNNITWLASYPKSGNTWIRIWLENLISDGNEPVHINSLKNSLLASNRNDFDELTGLNSSELSQSEINELRPQVYRKLSEDTEHELYIKIHDAFQYVNRDNPLIPPEVSKYVIYIIRNPLDLVISFSSHMGCNLDKAIELMNNNDFILSKGSKKYPFQLEQHLFSWSKHVKSWTEQKAIDTLVLRYEDLLENPHSNFKNVIQKIGLPYDDRQVDKAIRFSDFNTLQKQESMHGFKEKSPNSDVFFRHGKSGYWSNILNNKQVNRIINNHGEVMEKFGYKF